MNRILGSMAVALTASLVAGAIGAAPAAAETYPVTGRILSTYEAAGGAAVFGEATSAQTKLSVSSGPAYHQHFQNGTVVWSSISSRTWLNDEMPALTGVRNERIILALGDEIYRTGDLCHSSRFSKQLLASLLHGGAIIDLRTDSSVAKCKDPSLPGVSRYRYPMTSTTNLLTFATKQSNRDSLRRALRRIANTPGNVLVHCHMGRDRTGMVSTLLMLMAGVPLDEVKAEYLRSPNTDPAMFDSLISYLQQEFPEEEAHGMTFPGVHRFVTEALELDQTYVDSLQQRFGVS